jgi:ribosomal protein S12 methylthiotransferase accessory factor
MSARLAIAGIADMLVDPVTGIVSHVQEVPREPGSPDFFHFSARACDTSAFSRQGNFQNTGGAATKRENAVAKAIGEAVERYCAALYEAEELPLVSASEAPFSVIPPKEFALYSNEQCESPGFPWSPFNDDTPVRWTEGVDLVSGERRHVPAAMVYVPYTFYRGSGETPITQPISTGLAAHMSPALAALSGLYEVVERDAFTITWQAGVAPPQIRAETLSDAGYDLVQRFERTGAGVILFDLTLDHGITTILSVLRSTAPESPALVFAAASSLDPERAVRSALEELAHTRRYSQQIKSRLPRIDPGPDYVNMVDQVDHLNLYCDPQSARLADFLFTSKKRVDFDELPNGSSGDAQQDLAIACKRIAAIGHHVVAVDLTTDDVRSTGMAVARVIAPGFHPLFMGHRIRACGGRRLWTIPAKLNLSHAFRAGKDNPAPHPYP